MFQQLAAIRLTNKIIHNTPNVICRGTDGLTYRLTHILFRFRDKLSFLRLLVYNLILLSGRNFNLEAHKSCAFCAEHAVPQQFRRFEIGRKR